MNQVWVPSISKLLFQLFLTQKVRNESQERFTIGKYAAINGPTAAAKKNWIKEPTSQWKYRKRVLCHVQSRARESQEKKRPIVPNLNVLPRGRPLFWGSLNQMVQKILLALRSRGGLITSVIVVSVHGSHQSWKVLELCWNSGKVLERSWNFFVVKQSKREISK